MNPLTKEDIGEFQGVLFIRMGRIKEAMAGMKQEICVCKGDSVPAQGLRDLFGGCKQCKAIDRWFGNILK